MFQSQLTEWHFADLTVSKPIVKIVDFGHSFNGLNENGDEICKGNPMTLCPQQLEIDNGQRTQKLDQRADVWSMAVTMYFLLVGIYPFSGYPSQDPRFQQNRLLLGKYRIPKFLNLHPQTIQFMNSCMQHHDSNRPFWNQVKQSAYIQAPLFDQTKPLNPKNKKDIVFCFENRKFT